MPLLPKALQRFSIDGLGIAPQYIKATPAILKLTEQILDCFRFCSESTYGDLMSDLEPIGLQSQRHRLIKGLIHILESRLTFNDELEIDPMQLRETLFLKAARVDAEDFLKQPWRDEILKQTSEEFHISREQLENALYADLRDERLILGFEDIEPEALVAEYNLTLAKSLLLYARKLTFTIELGEDSAQSLRKLFQNMRFFNLLFEAEPLTDTIWQFSVDGPTSVLPQPQKYASDLASFLPTLYAFKTWHATSDIEIDGKHYTWQLKPDDFEAPVIRFVQRISEEAQQLAVRIPQIDDNWIVVHDYPILQFGPQSIWIPDFSIQHIQTKTTAHIEVLGFWRADYLNRRLKALEKAPSNLILVISDKLKLDAGTLCKTPVTIVPYKRTPRPQDILKAAEKISIKSK